MKIWIFVVTTKEKNGRKYEAEEVFHKRMEDSFWGIGEKTSNRKNLSKGDKVVFYVGTSQKAFFGHASLGSNCFKLSESDKEKYGHNDPYLTSNYGVLLEDIQQWEKPKYVQDLVLKLNFIENKRNWGSYFQGGVRQLSEESFNIILKESGESSGTLASESHIKDYENQSQFALESHLEEFIYKNWERINWGANLELYKTEDQNGRQFPAGIWSIDLLAVDKSNNDFVVIELKRGKSSDAVVGQILRYRNWIRENLAENQQNVRGIIIVSDVDESLRYSVKDLDYIEVKTYQVDFKLQRYEK